MCSCGKNLIFKKKSWTMIIDIKEIETWCKILQENNKSHLKLKIKISQNYCKNE
jgi:hypothetical protein